MIMSKLERYNYNMYVYTNEMLDIELLPFIRRSN